MVRTVREHLGGVLFHVTDEANAESIDRHGLLSKDQAAALGLTPRITGGNGLTRALDSRDGLSDRVFLSFFRSVLMPKVAGGDRQRRPMVLEIDPEVILLPGVEVRLGRGAHSVRVRAIQAFYKMDWETWHKPEIRNDLTGGKARWNTFLNYEILVPKCVSRKYILGSRSSI